MKTILVYTKFSDLNKAAIYDKWLPVLSPELRIRNLKYYNLDDRVRNLLGKLLLIKALELFGYAAISLDNLYYNEFRRPYLSPDFDFNITHSGSYIFCAIGPARLGIDIEEILPIDFNLVKEIMNPNEWAIINNAPFPLQEYYKYWTIKEAIIKADRRGFSLSPDKIQIKGDKAIIENITWYLQELSFDDKYYGYIAIKEPQNQIKMIYIDFD